MSNSPKVIVFDAFGTLVKIGNSRSPYLKLMKWHKQSGRKPTSKDACIIMSTNANLSQFSNFFGSEIPVNLLAELSADLNLDLDSIELYSDTIIVLQTLKNSGFKLALCSNLAMPYGEKLKKILPNLFDELILSYEIGSIKPDIKIYKAIQMRLNCDMKDILFIGDNEILDVEKPRSLGMSARLIQRNEAQTLNDVLKDILE